MSLFPHRHHHRLKGLTRGGSSNERHFSKPHFLWLVHHQPTVNLLCLQLATFSAQEGTFPAITVIFFHHSLEKVPDLKIRAIHCVVPNCNSATLSSKMAKPKRGKLHLYSRDIIPALQADQYLQAHGRTITLVDWSAFTPRTEKSARTTMTLPATNCPLVVRR